MTAAAADGSVVDAAAFTVGPGVNEPSIVQGAPATSPLRCASLLKPLYFWAAASQPAYRYRLDAWSALAEPAVTISANDSTVTIWETCGPDALLDGITELTGVHWASDPSAARSFGRVLIRADEVARAYAVLAVCARADEQVAGSLLGWMRQVPERQTFGARAAAARRLGVTPTDVAAKTGWFLDEDETALRTHAVTLTVTPDGAIRGTAVLTAVAVEETVRTEYATTYVHGEEVLPVHWEHAAETIARTTASLL